MSKIVPFDFDGHPIRVVTDASGEPWFSANEICDVLGFANPHDAVARHVDGDDLGKREVIDSVGRKQMANHVNESGLYALIFGSNKPEAKRFKKWQRSSAQHSQDRQLHRFQGAPAEDSDPHTDHWWSVASAQLR